jgi:hypothetical protein
MAYPRPADSSPSHFRCLRANQIGSLAGIAEYLQQNLRRLSQQLNPVAQQSIA